MRMCHLAFSTCALLACGAPLLRAADLRPFEASYDVSWHGLHGGVSQVRLEHADGPHWTYVSISHPQGLARLYLRDNVAQRSEMLLTPAGILPQTYTAENPHTAGKLDSSVQFDWTAKHASGFYSDVQLDLQLKPGVQDDLSVQIAMLDDLLHGREPELVSMLDKNTVHDYHYVREGEVMLLTPMGNIRTIIYRGQRENSPRVTRFWCAPQYEYVPMRAQQKRLDQVEWTMDIRDIKVD